MSALSDTQRHTSAQHCLILFCQHILLLCCRRSWGLLHSAQRVLVDVWLLSSSGIQNIGLQNDRPMQPHGLSNHRSFSCTPFTMRAWSLPGLGSSGDVALEFFLNQMIIEYLPTNVCPSSPVFVAGWRPSKVTAAPLESCTVHMELLLHLMAPSFCRMTPSALEH